MLCLLETTKRYYRLDRNAISFLKFIVEAYDGIATLTTIDPVSGLVVLRVAPGCEPDVDTVLLHLKQKINIESVQAINL